MGLRRNKKDGADSVQEIPAHQLIAHFMSASVPLEQYLQRGKPLTLQEIDLISLTVMGLQTFIEVWKRKNPFLLSRNRFYSFPCKFLFYYRASSKTGFSASEDGTHAIPSTAFAL